MAITVLSPFHRDLRRKLEEEILTRVEALADGDAAKPATHGEASVAERYAAKVSYIRALRQVLTLCEEMDIETYNSHRTERQD